MALGPLQATPPAARLTARGHQHVEAFCLMRYSCKVCQHTEVFWNSRDGVTPFGTACPSCGALELYHVQFNRDVYAPNHQPHKGQRVWVTLTKERALAMAKRNVLRRKKPGPETDLVIDAVAADYFHDGHGPDMRIEGYTEAL
jgi:hypothetical protein